MIHSDNRPIKYITPRESMELCRALAVDQLSHLLEAKKSAFAHLVADDLIERTERIIEEWDSRLNEKHQAGRSPRLHGPVGPRED